MDISLTFRSMAALFGAMAILAAIPSVSVLTVVARSVGAGLIHGVLTTLGIVVGDIVFILLAIYGLAILAETMGDFFVLVKYLGGAYLISLGIALWRAKPSSIEIVENGQWSLLSSFLTGLFITLADLKAILFYSGFFPAFFDLSNISILDTAVVILIAAIAVGGTKLFYAFIANRIGLLFDRSHAKRMVNVIAGSIMIAVGLFLLLVKA